MSRKQKQSSSDAPTQPTLELMGMSHPKMNPDLAASLLPRSMFPIRFDLAGQIGRAADATVFKSLPLDLAFKLLLAEVREIASAVQQHLNLAIIEAQKDPNLEPHVRKRLERALHGSRKPDAHQPAESSTKPRRPAHRADRR